MQLNKDEAQIIISALKLYLNIGKYFPIDKKRIQIAQQFFDKYLEAMKKYEEAK